MATSLVKADVCLQNRNNGYLEQNHKNGRQPSLRWCLPPLPVFRWPGCHEPRLPAQRPWPYG